jgi:DNA repair exonuclease SbcCD nuclease subunit
MSKFVILGDSHLGVRNDLLLFHRHFEKFYDRMIDDIVSQGITDIFQMGDLFDRRKYINFQSLAESKRYFFDRLVEAGITMHTLIGNHDIFFRESLTINTQSLILGEYNNIIIYDKPTTVEFDGTTIDIIPWICRDNEEEISKFIRASKSDLCFGHFEIAGFAMYRGMESHEGLSSDMFEKYELVCSGHYHTKSKKGNIVYVGTPYEMTWQDYADPKGYHIFDTKSRSLSFVSNPYTIFMRLDYDDTKELQNLDDLDLTDRFVKLVVINKTDLYKFDNYVQRLYNKGAYEIKIIEDLSEFSGGEVSEEIDLEDTMDVLSNYIDSIETDADKEKIKLFMKGLYVEAVNIEVVE